MFRKTTLAAALAALAAGPAAYAASEVALHGDFRGSLDHTSSTGTTGALNWQDNLSRIGVDASTEVGGIKAFVRYERLVSNDGDTANGENTLAFYGGVKTEFGTLYYGEAPTAFRNVAESIDPFFNTALASNSPFAFQPGGIGPNEAARGGTSLGLPLLTSDLSGAEFGNGYVSNTVGYKSPDVMGLRVNAAVHLDEASAGDGERHDYSAGVGFDLNGVNAGVQYANISDRSGNIANPGDPVSVWFAHAGADLTVAKVSAGYQRAQVSNQPNFNNYFVAGTVPLADNLRVAATYGIERPSGPGSFTAAGGNIALFYDVVPNLTTYVGARYLKQNTNSPDNLHSEAVAIGVSYSFRAAHTL